MGMYDYVKCLYPTPWPDTATIEFQTKDTPAQRLDSYEIRADGTLWHEKYDLRMEKTPESPFGFWMHRDHPRWVQEEQFTGQIEIYDGPYECIFWFRNGKVKDVMFSKDGEEVKRSASLAAQRRQG